jgi:hypothetical protein
VVYYWSPIGYGSKECWFGIVLIVGDYFWKMYRQMARVPEMMKGMISSLIGQRFVYCLGNVSGF